MPSTLSRILRLGHCNSRLLDLTPCQDTVQGHCAKDTVPRTLCQACHRSAGRGVAFNCAHRRPHETIFATRNQLMKPTRSLRWAARSVTVSSMFAAALFGLFSSCIFLAHAMDAHAELQREIEALRRKTDPARRSRASVRRGCPDLEIRNRAADEAGATQ